MERLQQLSDTGVQLLIQTLESNNMEDSLHALCFLKQVVEWKDKCLQLTFSVFSPQGDSSDCTFILMLFIKNGIFTTYYSSTESGCLRLKEALSETKLIGAETYCVMTSIPDRVHSIVGSEWRRKVAGPEQLVQDCHCYVLPHQTAVQLALQCPDDVYLRDLTPDDAELINSEWPHHNSISLSLIQGVISTSTCVGLCSKESGQLLSWALKWYYGGIGVVQTLKQAKRRGYARIVCTELAKRMARQNWPIHLVIIDGNPESTPLFTSMGFLQTNKNYWLYYNVFDC